MGTTPNRSWSRCPRNSSRPRRTAGGAAPPALARKRARAYPVDRCLGRRDLRAWPDHQHQGKATAGRAKQPLQAFKDDAPGHVATARRRTREGHDRDGRQGETGAARSARPPMADFGDRSGPTRCPPRPDSNGRQHKANSDRPDSLTHLWAVGTEQPQEPALAAQPHPPTGSVQGRDGPSGGPGPAYQTRRSNPMSDAPIGPDHPAITCRAGSPDSREWVNCDRYPDQVGTGPARLVRRVIDSLVRGWHDGVYLHQRRLEAQRPWEKKDSFTGDANWAVGGSSVPASHHKTDHAPRSMIAMKIQRRESVWTDDERIIRHLPFSDDRQPA